MSHLFSPPFSRFVFAFSVCICWLMLTGQELLAQPCAAPPSGMVAWWAAEGTANDSAGTNHGVLYNGTGFAPGKSGQAFIFNGINNCVTNSRPGMTNILDS